MLYFTQNHVVHSWCFYLRIDLGEEALHYLTLKVPYLPTDTPAGFANEKKERKHKSILLLLWVDAIKGATVYIGSVTVNLNIYKIKCQRGWILVGAGSVKGMTNCN